MCLIHQNNFTIERDMPHNKYILDKNFFFAKKEKKEHTTAICKSD